MALLASSDVGVRRRALLEKPFASLGSFTTRKKITGGCACGSIRYQPLDMPGAMEPDVHIYILWKANWLKLPKGTPSFRDYYNVSKLWPKASLKRANAALRGKKS